MSTVCLFLRYSQDSDRENINEYSKNVSCFIIAIVLSTPTDFLCVSSTYIKLLSYLLKVWIQNTPSQLHNHITNITKQSCLWTEKNSLGSNSYWDRHLISMLFWFMCSRVHKLRSMSIWQQSLPEEQFKNNELPSGIRKRSKKREHVILFNKYQLKDRSNNNRWFRCLDIIC